MTTEITKIIKGFKQFSENPYSDTIEFLKDYIKVEPRSECYFELGKALFLNEEYGESIKYLEKSDDARSDAYLGLDYYKLKDYENAVGHFEEFLRKNSNETILSYLMLCHEKTSSWSDAIECGERLLDMNPKNSSIKMRLGDYHFNLKEYEKSLDYINDLDDEKLKYKKGLVLFKLKRYEDAIEELKSIKSIESYRLISKAYEKLDKPSKAIRYLMKIFDENQDIEILFEISQMSPENATSQHCINTLEKVLEIDPNNERALEGIARSYLELQKFEFAIKYCEELLKVNENNANAFLILSETFYLLKDIVKALECVENGLSIDPKSTDLWIQKAWIYYLFNFEEFKKSYEKAIKLEPNNTKNYIKLIYYCYWDDSPDIARKYYEKLLLYNPVCTISFEEIVKN